MRQGKRTFRRGWRVPVSLLTGLGLAAAAVVVPTSTASASTPAIPAAAFHDHTGVTSSTVTVGNISTQTAGLFLGALEGSKAYADYINSTGGVHGRKLVIDGADDGYNDGAENKALTANDITNDFAMVGGFSLNDAYGATVLAKNPSVPNVTVSLSSAANQLPNTFSPQPADDGWELGPLVYFQKKYPSAVKHAASLVADEPAATAAYAGEKAAMEHLGYKVVYDPTYAITQTDFTQNVIAMRNDGVKILFVEQMPENYASAVFKALDAQDFHPVVVLGASTYSNALISASGGAAATDGAYLEQAAALYLGQDAQALPAVNTFLDLGAEGRSGVQARPLHPVRMAVDGAVHPGPAEGGHRPVPRIGAAGAAVDLELLREQPAGHLAPGDQDPGGVLHHRQDRQRGHRAHRRPAGDRFERRLPVRPAVLHGEREADQLIRWPRVGGPVGGRPTAAAVPGRARRRWVRGHVRRGLRRGSSGVVRGRRVVGVGRRRVTGSEPRVRWPPGWSVGPSWDRPAGQASAPSWAAARFIRRDLRLAAWFLWMTPLAAALSIRLMASRSASGLFSAPSSMAEIAFLVRVRSSERTDLLRAWRLRV